MDFTFYNPVKVITGDKCVQKNADELSALGSSCLIVTSGTAAIKSGALRDVTTALESRGIRYIVFDGIEQNPSVLSCQKAGETACANGLDFIIGIGGGSPLDAAKAAAVYATNKMDCMDIYKMDWINQALPIAAVGTTAGTGSEVTCFSILTMTNGRKKSFGNTQTYPKVMLGDARYTETVPLVFTVSTALDALSHALEGYFSSAANEITDAFAIEAVSVLCPELRKLAETKNAGEISYGQRERLYYASIAAGFTLSQCGTLYCHNLGYYLTENHAVPHGFACAATLPDLVTRGSKYTPERAGRLFEAAKTGAGELCGIIESLRILPPIKLSDEVIRRLSAEGAATKNFAKTLPDGFTAADAEVLLTKLFK